MNLTQALRYRPFALLWSGQTISRFGDSLYLIALMWWVVEKTGSASVAGNVSFFTILPMVIFLLVGGVAADRLPRVRVMIASDWARAALVGLIALLVATDRLEIWHIYAVSLLFGFVDAFFQPAYSALVPEVTPVQYLASANALTSLSRTLSGIVGPAVGAALVKLGGTPTAFALNALSFVVAGACLIPIRRLGEDKPKRDDVAARGPLSGLREGLRVVFADPWLWISIFYFTILSITLFSPITISLPFLVERDLKADVDALGLLTAISSFGSIVAAVLLGRVARLRRRGLLLYGMVILGSLGLMLVGLSGTLFGAALGLFVYGAMISGMILVWLNTMQERVPGELLGRVSSVDWFGSLLLLPIGYALTGILTDRIGASAIFVGGGAISAGLCLLILLVPAIRKLD